MISCILVINKGESVLSGTVYDDKVGTYATDVNRTETQRGTGRVKATGDAVDGYYSTCLLSVLNKLPNNVEILNDDAENYIVGWADKTATSAKAFVSNLAYTMDVPFSTGDIVVSAYLLEITEDFVGLYSGMLTGGNEYEFDELDDDILEEMCRYAELSCEDASKFPSKRSAFYKELDMVSNKARERKFYNSLVKTDILNFRLA